MLFFMFFVCVLTDSLCGCFFQGHFIDLSSRVAASLFSKLTYLIYLQPNLYSQRL